MKRIATIMVIIFIYFLVFIPAVGLAAEGEVTLTVNPGDTPSDDIGKVRIYAGTASDFTAMTVIDEIVWNPLSGDPVPQGSHTFTDIQAGAETTYYFYATFVDNAGNESGTSPMATVVFDFLPPGPPGGLTVTFRIITR